jgi:predicted acetyltransferase
VRHLASDGVVALRPFDAATDRQAIVDGRDDETRRWLGPESSDPAPTYCIEVAGTVVGWIDIDGDQPWLQPGEGNLGYCIFPGHRRQGYAARAVRLMATVPRDDRLRWALLVIDVANAASLGVARASGARLRSDRELPQFSTSVVYGIELSRA